MTTSVQETIDAFFSAYTKLSYKANEMIIRAGEPPPGIYYLKEGYIRMYAVSETGDILSFHMFKPGSFFPMMWAFNDTPNHCFFETITPAIVVRAPRNEVMAFLKKNPEVLFDLTRRILLGLDGLLLRVESLVMDDAYRKVGLLLTYLSKHFSTRNNIGHMIDIKVTHRDIASWIGTTRETASLQIEEFKRRGLIEYHGRFIVVPDVSRLEDEMRGE